MHFLLVSGSPVKGIAITPKKQGAWRTASNRPQLQYAPERRSCQGLVVRIQIVRFVSRTGTESTKSETETVPLFAGMRTSTCHTPEIDPGNATAETTVAARPPPNVIGRFKGMPGFGLTEPVTGAGTVTPRPARKILTTEPATAGFEHVLREPSLLKASGKNPSGYPRRTRSHFSRSA